MSEEDYLYQFSILDSYKIRCIGTLPTLFSHFFSSPERSPGRAIVLPPGVGVGIGIGIGGGIGGGVSVSKKCNFKVFYVMGKALSG